MSNLTSGEAFDKALAGLFVTNSIEHPRAIINGRCVIMLPSGERKEIDKEEFIHPFFYNETWLLHVNSAGCR